MKASTRTASRLPETRVDDIGDHISCFVPGARSLATVGMPGVTNTSHLSAESRFPASVISLFRLNLHNSFVRYCPGLTTRYEGLRNPAGYTDQFECPSGMRLVRSISRNRCLSNRYHQATDFGHYVKRNQEVGDK